MKTFINISYKGTNKDKNIIVNNIHVILRSHKNMYIQVYVFIFVLNIFIHKRADGPYGPKYAAYVQKYNMYSRVRR
jgi:hypothetical protein